MLSPEFLPGRDLDLALGRDVAFPRPDPSEGICSLGGSAGGAMATFGIQLLLCWFPPLLPQYNEMTKSVDLGAPSPGSQRPPKLCLFPSVSVRGP